MKGQAVVIVCRSANEPLKPGNKVGYACKYCSERLQVSATGLEMLRKHPEAEFLCNPCGMLYATFAEEMGKLELRLGPRAKEYMNSERAKGDPFAEWVRQKEKK